MKRLVSLLLLTSFSVLAFAQNQPVVKLTLEESVKIAFKNNVTLQKQKNTVTLAKADYLRTIGLFLPDLNAGTSLNYNEGTDLFDQADTAGNLQIFSVNSKSRSYSWRLSSNLNLFNGFSDYLSLEKSSNDLESAKLTFSRSAQSTLLDVSSKYLDVLLKQELLGISKENLVYADEQLKKISEMTRLGSRPLIDLYNQQYQKANAELEVINAEKSLDISKSNLVAALALDPTKEYEIIKPDLALLSSKTDVQPLDVLMSSALKSRPDYQASKLGITSRKSQLWQAYSNYLPSLDASWSWNANARSNSNISIPKQLSDNRSWSVGLTLSIPIFTRFQNEYQLQSANVSLKNAELDLSDLERTIQISVKQAFLDYVSYKKKLEASETQAKAATTLKETAQERYNVGAGSYVELADAIRQYTSAASGLAQTKYQYEFQKKVLDFYIGDLKIEDYVSLEN